MAPIAISTTAANTCSFSRSGGGIKLASHVRSFAGALHLHTDRLGSRYLSLQLPTG